MVKVYRSSLRASGKGLGLIFFPFRSIMVPATILGLLIAFPISRKVLMKKGLLAANIYFFGILVLVYGIYMGILGWLLSGLFVM